MHKLTQSANHLSKVTLRIMLGFDRLLHAANQSDEEDAHRQTKRHVEEAQEALNVIREELERHSR